MATERITLLGIPIDILKPEDVEETVMNLLAKETPQQVVFLNIWDLLNARYNCEFRDMVMDAGLVLPISKSIISGVKFLKKPVPVRRQTFDVVIEFLNVIDSHYKSLYILGGRQKSLFKAEKNVRSTFPGIKLVGRFTGYHSKTIEPDIITAISKAEPAITIVGNGISGGRKWAYRNKGNFKSGIFLRESNIIDIFSKTKNKPSAGLFKSGLDYLPKVLKNPFRLFNIFRFMWYKVLLLWYRLFKNDS
ncbi:MAG: UDP-N-acetyl-D-mannosamine transferase [Treponema sp.]|nr:MAG: UDP-N-acetyl-D-mannosamine transferase [Treponema sp.]